MSANGLNDVEDAEMRECEGDKVVTMMDVLQEQQDFEDDANAVLGASDEKNCTYSKGYIKRQAIYACLTCCADAKTDPSKRAGVCLACSLSCHEDHELIELYTKRNFRCDCGNPKFNSHPCQFTSNKTDLNDENNYNHNFCGIYCICRKPYPDPEVTDEEEMIQCIICEDWLHSSHLDATVPGPDMYSEMICKACMEKNEFLHDYSQIAVNSESVEIDITTINASTLDNTASACNGDSLVAETSCLADETSLIDAGNNDVPLTTNCNIEMEPIIMSVEGNISMDEQNKDSNEMKTKAVNGNEDPITDSKECNEISEINVDAEDVPKATEFIDKEPKEVVNDNKLENEIQPEAIELTHNVETVNDSEKINDNETSEIRINNEDEGTKTLDSMDTTSTEMNNKDLTNAIENNLQDIEEKKIDEDSINKEVEQGDAAFASSKEDSIDKEVEQGDAAFASSKEDSIDKEVEKGDAAIASSKEDSINKEVEQGDTAIASSKEDFINKEVEHSDGAIASVSENINSDVQLDNLSDEVTPNQKDKENEINKDTKSSDEIESHSVIPETDSLKSDTANEQKRKHSPEVVDGSITKKAKLDESSICIRPKGVKNVIKGASFWPSNFRQKLCTCIECISMYKDLSVLFLTDLDDTVSAYEMLGKERVDGTTTQYEKGLEALSSLDRVQQINALTEYNNMRDKLLDFLKSFKDRKEVVKEEDIKEFFAGMKPKRESDGVYFCR